MMCPLSGLWGLYIGTLIVLIILCFVNQIVNIILCATVVFIIAGVVCYFFIHKRCCHKNANNDNTPVAIKVDDIELDNNTDGKSTNAIDGNTDDINEDNNDGNGNIGDIPKALLSEENGNKNDDVKRKTPSKRLYYLDNIKSILTVIVVLHHIVCLFSGVGWYYMIANYYNTFKVFGNVFLNLNQSYFMCLFFFISAYFTPTSCDKKGRRKFLEDKYQRLGIPFLIYGAFMAPLLNYFNWIVIGQPRNTYMNDAGPCWFLAWLLIFNTIYVTFGDHIPIYKAQFPSFTVMFFVGILLGLPQIGIQSLGTFIFMPTVIGSLPYDILFFTCGIMAKRNDWLKKDIPNLSKCKVYILRCITIGGSLAWITVSIVTYIYDVGFNMRYKNATDDCIEDDQDYNFNIPLYVWIIFYLFMGLMTIVISLTILQFSQEYLNFSNKYSQFIASHAYTVYLIHPLVLTPIAWSYLPIMNSIGANIPYFCKDSNNSKTDLGADGYIWLGFIYTSILTLIAVFALAWMIKKLPGLRHIL